MDAGGAVGDQAVDLLDEPGDAGGAGGGGIGRGQRGR